MREEAVLVFIHGAWVTPMCWRYFEPHFTARGFQTLTPAWPFKGRTPEDQLLNPDPRLAKTGIPEIVAHFKAIIGEQVKPVVLIGHSFGGLIVQILLDHGFGAGGIALNSIPPRGVAPMRLFSIQSLRRLRSMFGTPFSWRKVLAPPGEEEEERALRQAQGIQKHLVPESGRIFWQLLSSAARVNFGNHDRPPLLLVACGNDRCVPTETQRRNRDMYHAAKARTDFAFFPDLTHLSIAEPGHERLAALCAAWIDARLAERETGEQEKTPTAVIRAVAGRQVG
jgi:alpha-beta hydrolase superfamily lysophospholipase